MTRENKLAMVVGFGLLLFVGILVSDHFSTAQRQAAAVLNNPDRTRERVSRPISLAAVPATGGAQPTEVMIGMESNKDVRRISNQNLAGSEVVVENSKARTVSNALDGTSEVALKGVEPSKKVKVQESEPGVQLHPIADGETLYSICAKTYGDGSLWKELAQYNKKELPNAAKLRKGVTLRLPPVEQLRQGAVVATTMKGARVSATPQEQESALLRGVGVSKTNQEVPLLAAADISTVELSPSVVAAKTSVIEIDAVKNVSGLKKVNAKSTTKVSASPTSDSVYVVQKGDTLGSIAKKKLGKTSRWKDIVAANGSDLSDPAALSPGMSIQLPKTN